MKYKTVIFGPVREAALSFWLNTTRREKFSSGDAFNNSFECDWQNNFKSADDSENEHCSIFCSMGDWNTMVTHILDDKRFDGFNIEHEDNAGTLFRYYTMLLLLFSEVMTDFQDVLNVFRCEKFNFNKKQENEISRSILSSALGPEYELQNWFDFVNSICKHKTKGIHLCNHHIDYKFEDGGNVNDEMNFIHLQNVRAYILEYQNKKSIKVLETVFVPSLQKVLQVIVSGYQIVDQEFRNDPKKFSRFRKLYNESSYSV